MASILDPFFNYPKSLSDYLKPHFSAITVYNSQKI